MFAAVLLFVASVATSFGAAPKPTVDQLSALQNWKNALAKLEVLLSNAPSPSEASVAAQSAMRAALKQLF